jgi:hypothetical protein
LGIVARGGSKVLQLKGFTDETLQEIELFSKSASTLTFQIQQKLL